MKLQWCWRWPRAHAFRLVFAAMNLASFNQNKAAVRDQLINGVERVSGNAQAMKICDSTEVQLLRD